MVVQKGHLLQSPHVDIIVDDVILNDVVEINLTHEIDKARTLTCIFKGDASLLHCRLGAIVSMKQHIGKPISGVFSDDNSFLGIIKSILPTDDAYQFIAFDFTTLLAESQFINYKLEDYIGEDLYFAAASACDYKFQGEVSRIPNTSIDVSNLKNGSGIFITEDMDLFGWKTRKEFIDACFNEMKVLRDDVNYKQFAIQQFHYGIHKDNIMSFFAPDPSHKHAMPLLTLSKANNNIPKKGIVSQIDTTKLVNAITVVSKSDSTLYAQRENASSIARFGVLSKFIQLDTTDINVLDNAAELILRRFDKPSIFYNIVAIEPTNLHLGDLVKIKQPELGIDEILPIVSIELNIGVEVVYKIKVGERPITLQEELELISKPTDR
tara:strand:- start:456 stop:1595 length:1140 start_codon:yes stop_codon:yes gene_type:complete